MAKNYDKFGDKACRYIAWHWKHLGCSPSIRDIGKAVGLESAGSVHRLLVKLAIAGRIQRDPYKRIITIVDEANPALCEHDWRILNEDFQNAPETLLKCLKCQRRTAVEMHIDWDNPETCPRFMGEVE
jgi:SOS-response transcriptional repressor LexA